MGSSVGVAVGTTVGVAVGPGPAVGTAVGVVVGAGLGDGDGDGDGDGLADGAELTVMSKVMELLPPGPVAVNVTLYVSGLLNVCDGFCSVLVAPSPKSQSHDVTSPVLVSVKLTINGASPDNGSAVKSATGIGVGVGVGDVLGEGVGVLVIV
jgi:hypothetical protein